MRINNPSISRIVYADILNKKISYVNPDNPAFERIASIFNGDVVTSLTAYSGSSGYIIDQLRKELIVLRTSNNIEFQAKLNLEVLKQGNIWGEYKQEISMIYHSYPCSTILISKCKTKIKYPSWIKGFGKVSRRNFFTPMKDTNILMKDDDLGYLIWHDGKLMFIIK